MYKPHKDQNFESEFNVKQAQSYVGKQLLFGISYLNHDGNLLRQEQGYGELIEITEEIIAVRLAVSGEIFTLPPLLSALHPAAPGQYKLRSTGEILVNPDLIGQFRCTDPDH